ncbi:FtsX-like permease family protein [Streptomyces sp. I05A-00742]|uniref:FtsX-like permease family protein n=1 Tax=Streptomyces sp. I05A-00742 TaxID=2732853 RepID=UPI00201741E3|nr:FtsX-like permease family protein [Streptomyces sp. I05A-00742]
MIVILTVLACVVLLTPVAVFIATSVRFGGAGRDRRLAALRLLGADLGTVRRIAAGEALAGSVLGLGFGAVVFLWLWEYARYVTLLDINLFPSDVVPAPWILALTVLAVPVCSVAVALFALRGVIVEPLGGVRDTAPRRRRLWWRLLLPALGAALLTPFFAGVAGRLPATPPGVWQVAMGATLLLIGVAALLPWAVEVAVARIHGGPPAWQLAVRRLQLNSGPAPRAVSGITVAVAGAIALQTVFTGVQGRFESPPVALPTHSQLEGSYPLAPSERVRDWADRLRATKGVRAATGYVDRYIEKDDEPGAVSSVVIGDCATLARLADIGSCRDGDVFLGRSEERSHTEAFRPGSKVAVTPYGGNPAHAFRWTVPGSAREVRTRPGPTDDCPDGVLATPAALDASALPDVRTRLFVRTDPDDPDAIERVRNTAAGFGPGGGIRRLGGVVKDDNFALLQRGLALAAAGMLALVGAGMLVSTLEQLRERRRLLASLAAVGVPRRTLVRSVLWQTAIPVLLGMAAAVGTGLGLGWAILRLNGGRVADRWVFWPVTCAGMSLIGLVTLAALPALLRMARPDGLRTE